jgi:hypothetical protein
MAVNPTLRIIELRNGNFSVQETRNTDYGPDWFDVRPNVELHEAEAAFNQIIAQKKANEGRQFARVVKES